MAELAIDCETFGEIHLISGSRIVFHGGRPPEEERVIPIVDQRRLKTLGDFRSYLAEDGRAARKEIHIPNGTGSWIVPAAFAAASRFETIRVYQDPTRDEALTRHRVIMTPEESDLCFLPNYKCGYTSMRTFLRAHFPSCAAKDPKVTHALNSYVDLASFESGFLFSIIRDPADRFGSFFVDKFCRGEGHHNHRDYRLVYEALLAPSPLTPHLVLDFVSRVPVQFADRHWKSVYRNLHHEGTPLVSRVYDISATDAFVADVAAYLGREASMPHELSTRSVSADDTRRLLKSDAFRAQVKAAFPEDARFHEATMAEGGVLRFDA